MDWQFREDVRSKTRYQFHLSPVFQSTLNIPERLHEYNPRMFICFNNTTSRFEVHSLDQADSYSATLPYRQLDARSLRWVWENDIRVHGRKIFDELDKTEDRIKKAKERELRNFVESVGAETRSEFAKDAWTIGT